jgi:hypothetical protein
MLEGTITWSCFLVGNYYVSKYNDFWKLSFFQEIKLQDYVKSGSLVEYSFAVHYLEGSRVSYDFVRNLYGCVKDSGRQPLVPDSVFASIILQFTNWNSFPFSRQFNFRGMNSNLSIDVPILVNGTGVSAVSLDLR